jgi:hypothetical protein
MGPIEEQVEAELACAGQRVCTPYFADACQAEFADDLSALTGILSIGNRKIL